MKTKYLDLILAIIIIVASAVGYLAYTGAFNANSNSSNSPTPTPTISPAQTTPTPTATSPPPTPSPVVTASPTPTIMPTPTPIPATLTIFIASSLANVVANMTKAFKQQYNCKIVVNSASSSTLEQQIAAGSPCDVFMSADIKWTNTLATSNLIYNNFNTNFTTNSLCIILAQGNPKNITTLADLASNASGTNKIHVVIAQTSVPVGSYTNQTLTKINNTWGNPNSSSYDPAYANYYTNFQNNVINTLQTDEQVVGAVNLNVGVADAGIVFYSDEVYANLIGETVQFLPIPSSVNTVGTYGICIPNETTQSTLAQTFYNYWLSTTGQTLLTQFGFGSQKRIY